MVFKFIELHYVGGNNSRLLVSPKLNSLLYFACRRKDVHLYFIMSPGKMIFAVLYSAFRTESPKRFSGAQKLIEYAVNQNVV